MPAPPPSDVRNMSTLPSPPPSFGPDDSGMQPIPWVDRVERKLFPESEPAMSFALDSEALDD